MIVPASSEAIFQELQSVCAGSAFVRAGEARRLLCFLVEMERAGRTDDLREVQIASLLYGRPPGYDPKTDGIVRVNAARLRVRLTEHYSAQPSALRIILPVGTYVPTYEKSNFAPPHEHDPGSPIGVGSTPGPATAPDVGIQPAPLKAYPKISSLGLLVLAAGLSTLAIPWFLARAHVTERNQGRAWISQPFSRLGGIQEFPAFSPDGHSIAFTWFRTPNEEPAIYVQDLHGDTPRLVTGQDHAAMRPAWSNDKSKLAFVQYDSTGLPHIVIRSLADGKEKVLFTSRGPDPWLCHTPKISWAPDGKELYTAAAFADSSTSNVGDGQRCNIVSIRLADGSVRTLTSSAGTLGDLEPTVSSDGHTIAFVRSLSYAVDDVYTVNSQGGASKRVTFDSREIQGLQWSPDHTLVLAARSKDGVMRLVKRDLHTGQETLLSDGSAPAAFPSISSDGRQIVFTVYRGPTLLFRASPSAVTALVNDGTNASAPHLSFDGKHLTFTSERSGFAEVWIGDPTGHNAIRLTNSDGVGAHDPSWFPDDLSVLFECRDQGYSQICSINANGLGTIKYWTSDLSDHILPSLSRDGRFLYYLSDATGRREAYRMPTAGGRPTQISSGGSERVMESWDGNGIYVESRGDGVGFLLIPNGPGTIDTRLVNAANRAFLLPSLKKAMGGPWTTMPGGLVVYQKSIRPDAIIRFDQATKTESVFARIPVTGEPSFLNVTPDGRAVLYSTVGNLTAELDLLTHY